VRIVRMTKCAPKIRPSGQLLANTAGVFVVINFFISPSERAFAALTTNVHCADKPDLHSDRPSWCFRSAANILLGLGHAALSREKRPLMHSAVF
jgi:hypothetical protein